MDARNMSVCYFLFLTNIGQVEVGLGLEILKSIVRQTCYALWPCYLCVLQLLIVQPWSGAENHNRE